MHYRRWLRNGDPTTLLVIHGDTDARFDSKVDKTGPNGCWLWTGVPNDDGYGMLGTGGTSYQLAHRWSYEHHVGPIPDGFVIDHLCRIRNCVNPAHMEVVTPAENTRRGAAVRTSCINGHDYTDSNTQWVLSRVCKTCRDSQKGAYYQRARQNKKKSPE